MYEGGVDGWWVQQRGMEVYGMAGMKGLAAGCMGSDLCCEMVLNECCICMYL